MREFGSSPKRCRHCKREIPPKRRLAARDVSPSLGKPEKAGEDRGEAVPFRIVSQETCSVRVRIAPAGGSGVVHRGKSAAAIFKIAAAF